MSDAAELAAMKAELATRMAKIEALEKAIASKESATTAAFPYSESNLPGRVLVKKLVEAADGGASLEGSTISVGGWVRTGREQGNKTFAFLEVNDGSSFASLQVIVPAEVHELKPLLGIGTCVGIEGVVVRPEGREQACELQATKVVYVGACGEGYPLHKGKVKISNESLRQIAHIRPRTNIMGAVLRVRNSLAFSTHAFFNSRNFFYMHSPLITASDCEGAGEMFQVTTLLNEVSEAKEGKPEGVLPADTEGPSLATVEAKKAEVAKQQGIVDAKTAAGANKKKLKDDVKKLEARKKELEALESIPATVGGIPIKADRSIDYKHDFFGIPTFLTVSGQLQAEIGACALSNVYTFGPTFRAED